MAEVGARVVGNDAEINDHGQIKNIGCVYGYVQGRIVRDAHGALHPIDDRTRIFSRSSGAAHEDAGLIGQQGEFRWNLAVFGRGSHRARLLKSAPDTDRRFARNGKGRSQAALIDH